MYYQYHVKNAMRILYFYNIIYILILSMMHIFAINVLKCEILFKIYFFNKSECHQSIPRPQKHKKLYFIYKNK